MNITGAVAVQSPLGLIELEKNGVWNLTLTNSTVDVVCERDIELDGNKNEKNEGKYLNTDF